MFRSWLERLNHFADVYLDGDELVSYLSEAVAITRHKIQTRSFQLHQGKMTGFVGTVTFQVPQRFDPLLANVANLLVTYAPFCGTGMKTRLGMGQTQIYQAKRSVLNGTFSDKSSEQFFYWLGNTAMY